MHNVSVAGTRNLRGPLCGCEEDDVQTHRFVNGVKTLSLFVVLWLIVLTLGSLISGGRFLWIFAMFGVISTAVGYWNSATLAIRSMHARPVTEVEQPAMYRIVRELSREANQPMLSLYVAPTSAPNAFATGRSPSHAAVCCTDGILQMLDERELRGVLGHELMHVYNRDILIGSVAAAVAGVITSVAQFLLFFGDGRSSRDNPFGPLALLVMMFLAPIAASLIRLSISRTREFEADRSGSELTGDPLALASALRKLEQGTSMFPLRPTPQLQNVSHLFIANPFREVGLSRLFSTHPSTQERIARLESMQYGRGPIR